MKQQMKKLSRRQFIGKSAMGIGAAVVAIPSRP